MVSCISCMYLLKRKPHKNHINENSYTNTIRTGAQGEAGAPAPKPKPIPHRGFFFAYHSQTDMTPDCPKYTTKLWSGYSLLHLMGNGRPAGQDLGKN